MNMVFYILLMQMNKFGDFKNTNKKNKNKKKKYYIS